MFTDTQIREVFHFCFLDRLLKLSDPGLYILKGGVNLRFFFNSPRYSEDMDIDVLAGSVQALKKNGYKILNDGAFKRSLRSFGIADIDVNDPAKAKQTDTTQRFRFGLITPAGHRLPTKIEFSRRKEAGNGESELALVDEHIVRRYRKLAFRCRHYTGSAAIVQKIRALAGRPVTQARDVFDLAILFKGGHGAAVQWSKQLEGNTLPKAIDCLLGLTWQDYAGQVVEFLDADSKAEYGGKDAWDEQQTLVLSRLQTDA